MSISAKSSQCGKSKRRPCYRAVRQSPQGFPVKSDSFGLKLYLHSCCILHLLTFKASFNCFSSCISYPVMLEYVCSVCVLCVSQKLDKISQIIPAISSFATASLTALHHGWGGMTLRLDVKWKPFVVTLEMRQRRSDRGKTWRLWRSLCCFFFFWGVNWVTY